MEADWAALEAAGLRMETLEPLAGWRVAFTAEGAGFDVRLTALTGPIELEEAGGMQGYDQLCRVQGTAVVGGNERPLGALGQRTHAGASPTGTDGVSADGRGLDRRGSRRGPAGRAPPGARGHDADAVSAWMLGEDGPQQLSRRGA